MAEDLGREHGEQHKVQRVEQGNAGPEGAPAPEIAPSYPTLLPGDPRLEERGNQPVRNAVMRQAQKTYGNRAVQRWLAGQGQGISQDFGERAVQRWEASHQARTSLQRSADGADAASAEEIGERGESKDVGGGGLGEGTDGTLSISGQNIQRMNTPVQRQPPGNQPGSAGGAALFIVPDTQAQPGPGQMTKSAFLAEVRTTVDNTVSQTLGPIEAVVARPMVDQQFNSYQQLDNQALESTIRREVPGAGQAASARDYIPAINQRVRASISGGGGADGGGTGIMGGLGGMVSGAASAVTSAVSSAISSVTSLFFKGNSDGPREVHDPAAVQSELGPGQSLDSHVRSGMEGAFGYDFSGVRVHTDGTAAQLSGDMNARAFAVGQNVAFGSGEYQPGTLVGDALIAHELAHVVQQGGASASAGEAAPQHKGGAEYSALEEEADTSAVGAVASIWGGARGGLAGITPGAMPALKSGLRLSRCNGGGKPNPGPLKTVTVNVTYLTGGSTALSAHLGRANEVYKQANVEVKSGTEKTLSESESKAILGDDLILEEYSDPSAPTEEEKKLLKVNRKAGEITMYYVKALSQGSIGEAFWSISGTGPGFVFASPTSRTFPHELGHVLLDDGGHPSDNDNFMAQTSTATGKETMTSSQIATIRSSPYVK